MKIAISVPDEIYEAADEVADRLGLSRSELYARAVAEYVAKHRNEDITARLNEVYGDEASGLDPAVRTAQARSVGSPDW
ncbi:MAG: ribbon-helix-helix protein, CopG family [Gemmatimonadota bacterium]|nr:ribbon-helix-helix protein, CopG family [Gemmatimonadota bacterium]